MEHTSRSSPSHAPSPSAGVDPIHNIARTTFPVLAEPFLVDQNYEFVKELGQGALPPSLSWRRCERASGRGRGLTKDKDLRVNRRVWSRLFGTEQAHGRQRRHQKGA